ncbi:hypothetical protein HPB49_025238 [Dermacentor silvarum]|uniref:Uncharacterized protein n=1 Tax=Dermacentor silvarum TaxID=543639 RepID=A0ACB8E4H6_DERSI|nr:hypothetical protein HPB49_025238 [Dermacentor silvarum]
MTTTATSPSGSSTVCVASTALSNSEDATTTNQRTTDNAAYFQTFFTQIVNNDKSRYVRGIMEGGSQKYFVQEDVALKLNLKMVRETTLPLNTFRSTCPSASEKRKVVEVPL